MLAEALAAGSLDGYRHVVRTQTRVAELETMILEARGVALDEPVITLPDLVRRCAARRRHARRKLGPDERMVLIGDLARRQAGPPLRGVAGLDLWLAAFFSALKQSDVFSLDRVYSVFPSLDPSSPGTAEAVRLFGLYQARLVERDLYDDDGLYLEVARDLGTDELAFDRAFRARKHLVIEGYYQCNPVERAVFARLVTAFDRVDWLLDLPEEGARSAFGYGVFADRASDGAALLGDLRWLREVIGAEFVGAIPCGVLDPEDPLATLEPGIADRLRLVRATDDEEEAAFCAERAAAFVVGDPHADVVVVYPSDRDAAALLREAFAEVGVPLIVAAQVPLAETAPAQALLELLDLAARDFPRARVVTLLRSLPSSECRLGEFRLRASQVDRVSRAAGVVGGRAEWNAKLAAHVQSLTRDRATRDPDDAESVDRSLADAEAVARGMTALFSAIPVPSHAMGTRAFADLALALLRVIDPGAVRHDSPIGVDPLVLRATAVTAHARRALEGVVETWRRAGGILGDDDRRFDEHVAGIRELVRATTIPESPRPARGVRLLGLREIRGTSADHVIVAGLTADRIPGATPPTPLISEADATRAGLHTATLRRREVDHLLVHALASGRRSVTLVRPELVGGCEVPAATIVELLRTRVPEHPAAELLAHPGTRGRTLAARAAGRALAAATRSGRASADPNLAERVAAWVGVGGDGPSAWRRARIELERSDPARLGRFEGLLEPAALPALARRFDPATAVMSVSRFDDYAACPMMYFFRRILGITPDEEVDREPTPSERGSLVHNVLFRFHAEAAVSETEAARAARLDRIIGDEVARRGRDDLFAEALARRLRAGLTDDQAPGLFRQYLDAEARRNSTFQPRFFEARFGRAPDEAAPSIAIHGEPAEFVGRFGGREYRVRLVGSVDRVDIRERDGLCEAFIVDYKTSQVSHLHSGIKKGEKFQLPLYAKVLPELLPAHCGGKPVHVVGGGYYLIRPGETVALDVSLAEAEATIAINGKKGRKALAPGQLDDVVQAYTTRAAEFMACIADGRFHPTRDSKACEPCRFRAGCRGDGEGERIDAMSEPRRVEQRRAIVVKADPEDDA